MIKTGIRSQLAIELHNVRPTASVGRKKRWSSVSPVARQTRFASLASASAEAPHVRCVPAAEIKSGLRSPGWIKRTLIRVKACIGRSTDYVCTAAAGRPADRGLHSGVGRSAFGRPAEEVLHKQAIALIHLLAYPFRLPCLSISPFLSALFL